jgi:CBS domain-containing protein/SAM-dependent methyltransferase
MGLTAGDAMVRLEDCVQGDDSVLDAARRLVDLDANSIPVVGREGSPLGILASVDVVRAVATGGAPEATAIADVIGAGRAQASVPAVRAEDSLESILDSMRQHRAELLGVVDGEKTIGLVRRQDVEAFSYMPPDGLPLPPPDLIQLVSGLRSARAYRFFYDSGARSAETVTSVLGRNGSLVEDLGALLDFGCGCGRVIRHWQDLHEVEIFGSDYNPKLVDWCGANLPFAKFQTNGLAPELEYPDERFDLVYAFSVFTHLDADLQVPWLAELRRVVRKGGLVLLTLHGRARARVLGDGDREAFEAGELVVTRSEEVGTNACAAYHPERYVRNVLGAELELLELTPNGAPEISQDVVLFRNAA